MKAAGNELWINPNTGATNESGFTALPAGMHDFTNIFQWKGDHCAFSTSTWPLAYDYAATAIMLVNNSEKATIGDFHPDDAYSVRCVKNETGTEVKKNYHNRPDIIFIRTIRIRSILPQTLFTNCRRRRM